jgi:hypothetical protein
MSPLVESRGPSVGKDGDVRIDGPRGGELDFFFVF